MNRPGIAAILFATDDVDSERASEVLVPAIELIEAGGDPQANENDGKLVEPHELIAKRLAG